MSKFKPKYNWRDRKSYFVAMNFKKKIFTDMEKAFILTNRNDMVRNKHTIGIKSVIANSDKSTSD